MEKDLRCMEMEIIIKESSLMGCLKVMDAMFGMMEVCTKEILSKESEMDMVFGRPVNRGLNHIKDISEWM